MDKKVYCGAMLLASIVSTGCAEQKKVDEQKPNIIYFLVDGRFKSYWTKEI